MFEKREAVGGICAYPGFFATQKWWEGGRIKVVWVYRAFSVVVMLSQHTLHSPSHEKQVHKRHPRDTEAPIIDRQFSLGFEILERPEQYISLYLIEFCRRRSMWATADCDEVILICWIDTTTPERNVRPERWIIESTTYILRDSGARPNLNQ